MGQFSKNWEDLNFSDNFIFCKVMKNESLCKEMLKILLNLNVEKIEYLETEKQIENYYDSKGIRMDVFIQDSTKVIDLEMQTGNYDDLLLRSRYYQSTADVNTVPRHARYKNLKEIYIVFLCRDDPFGLGLPCYSKKTIFSETDKIPYNDKCHNVFYNASGFAKADNPELRNVLRFIYNLKADSDFTKRLDNYVKYTKKTGLMRDEYMYFQDILEDEKEEARAIGLAEGRSQGIREGMVEGKAKGLAEGRAEGRAEGKKEAIIETARKLLREKCSIELIKKITGLSKEEILQTI